MPSLVELEERLTRVEQELELIHDRERHREQSNPWVRMQGTLPDDELTEQWKQAMAAYRDEQDKESTQS